MVLYRLRKFEYRLLSSDEGLAPLRGGSPDRYGEAEVLDVLERGDTRRSRPKRPQAVNPP
jgi:hypothetical protein